MHLQTTETVRKRRGQAIYHPTWSFIRGGNTLESFKSLVAVILIFLQLKHLVQIFVTVIIAYWHVYLLQQSWCSPDDLDLLFDNSLGAFMVSQFDNDNEKLISSAASNDGYTFATPLPTHPFTLSSSQGRTPCSSGQSSPRRYSSRQVSPVWEGSGMLDGAEGGSLKDTKEKLPRYKRPSHINAEYKRRGKIQVKAHLHNSERYTTSPTG